MDFSKHTLDCDAFSSLSKRDLGGLIYATAAHLLLSTMTSPSVFDDQRRWPVPQLQAAAACHYVSVSNLRGVSAKGHTLCTGSILIQTASREVQRCASPPSYTEAQQQTCQERLALNFLFLCTMFLQVSIKNILTINLSWSEGILHQQASTRNVRIWWLWKSINSYFLWACQKCEKVCGWPGQQSGTGRDPSQCECACVPVCVCVSVQ